MRDGVPANKRSERDAEKESTVVPGENGGATSRKEQLGRRGSRRKRESDEHSGIDRKLSHEQARAETGEAYAARQLCSEPVDHATADQDAADRPASVKQNDRGDLLRREAAGGQPR